MEEVFEKEDGTLFIKDPKTGYCFILMPKDCLGKIDEQGDYKSLGTYNIEC